MTTPSGYSFTSNAVGDSDVMDEIAIPLARAFEEILPYHKGLPLDADRTPTILY